MKIVKLKNLSKKDYQRIVQRSFGTNEDIMPKVKKIIDDIKRNGDEVILNKYQQRYGKENYQSILVTKEEIRRAYQEIDKKLIVALKQMIKNITKVHRAQLTKKADTKVLPDRGIEVWREWRAIEKVGLYIPGGKAIYPSSVLMSAIPAQIAECREIIMCSPPGKDGQLPFATLVAAAMAYGTKTIPKVYKIFGAGNSFVTAAKMLVFGEVAIDMPAGPSEIFIIADKTATPSYIAADLLADGEHGEDSACVLISTSLQIAQQTIKEVEKQLKKLTTKARAKESLRKYGLFAVAESLNEAIVFTNSYAPEHLEIMT